MDRNPDQAAGEPIPERLGAYRILDVLGQGGMAMVYLAEQIEPIERQVAVKMLKRGMDTEQIVKRFDSERQALAVLEHPNIANVFDAGVSDAGLPYFVMELVRGQPINDHCDRLRLTARARIELFMDVCAAVQHAHLKGLIHRDLKPSNILVAEQDDDARPMIIDFGIAKSVSDDSPEEDQLTRLGTVLGTPQYMSPEQVAGQDIDTRTDVYSLGIVLYELLVGTTPIDMSGVSPHALGYLIRESESPTPSSRLAGLGERTNTVAEARATDTRTLQRELKGDLDWIVMKAVAKDRNLRYATANAFMEDLRRFLNHEPVSARPTTSGYLVKRFVRRNRAATVAGALAVLAMLFGTVFATIGFFEARRAEQLASREAETSQQISSFLIDLFRVSDPSEAKGNSLTARTVLDSAVGKIEQELDGEPAVQATLMQTMGMVYKNLGLYAEASRLAETALSQRRALTDPLATADSLNLLGELRGLTGKTDEAQLLLEQALALRREADDQPTAALVDTLQQLATIYYLRTDYPRAKQIFLQALEAAERAPDRSPLLLADVKGNLGVVYSEIGEHDKAPEYKRQALVTFRSEHGDNHPVTATQMNNLAVSLKTLGNIEEAGTLYRDALTAYRNVYDTAHPQIANTLNNLALVLLDAERFDAAAELQLESLAMYRELLGNDHSQIGTVMLNLGRTYARSGAYDDAERVQREALALHERVLDPAHERIVIARIALAITLNYKEDHAAAADLAQSALTSYRAMRGDEHWRTARAASAFGYALVGLGRYEEAEPLLTQSHTRIAAELGESSIAAVETLKSLEWLYDLTDRSANAASIRSRLQAIAARQGIDDTSDQSP